MAVRNDIIVHWDLSPRIVEVVGSSDILTLQDLYDTLRYLASMSNAMDDDEIVDGSGKETLSSISAVGLTVKLLNAKVKFEDKSLPTVCTIEGGNLVALDEYGEPMSPVEFSDNVIVDRASSSSPTLVYASGGSPEEISVAVANILILDHQEDGTLGKYIKDIKQQSITNAGLILAK